MRIKSLHSTPLAILPNSERVKIWNALFHRAIEDACALARIKHLSPRGRPNAKLALSPEKKLTLLLIGSCTMAIEARCNHMIDELAEKRLLSEEEARALQRLPVRERWFLLPRLVGSRKRFDPGKKPHQAIAEICSMRNALVHVNYSRLRIPEGTRALNLFRDFVEAMEETNVVVRRGRRVRRSIIDLGVFESDGPKGSVRAG